MHSSDVFTPSTQKLQRPCRILTSAPSYAEFPCPTIALAKVGARSRPSLLSCLFVCFVVN